MISQPETVYRLERPLQAGDHATQDPVMAALPTGWVGLKDSNVSGLLNHPQQVAYVLMHPQIGVALLDFSPGHLDGAAETLHHRLEAARFEAIFPGHLPITELILSSAEVPALERTLAAAFAALPPLSVPGGDGWISVVRRALQPRDPARAATLGTAPVGGVRLIHPREVRGVAPPAAEHAANGAAIDTVSGDHLDAMAAPAPTPRRGGFGLALLGGAALAGLILVGVAMVWPGAEERTASAPITEPLPAAEPPQPPPGLDAPSPRLAAPRGMEAAGASVALPPTARPAPSSEVRAVPPADIRPAPLADIRTAPPRPAPPPEAKPASPPAAAVPPSAASLPQAPPLPPPAPPPPPASASASAARVVVRTPANLRSAPNSRARILRTAPAGESFRIHGTALGGWVQVGDAEPQGWIHSTLLRDSR